MRSEEMIVTADRSPQPESTDQPEQDNADAQARAPAPAAAERSAGSDAPAKSSGVMTKVLGGIGAVVTSIVVGLGVKYSDHFISKAVVIQPPGADTAKTPATPPAPATAPAPATTPATTPMPPPVKTPPDPTMLYNSGPPVALFNGKDLSGFFSILGDPKELKEVTPAEPLGKNNDPLKVFTVQDGLLRVSGEVYGSLLTEKEYENYLVTAEYKWGEQTWPPRVNLSRNSGILLHCVGPDDAVRKCFPQSIRCRIQEGRTGGLRLLTPELSSKIKRQQRLTVECEDMTIPGPNPLTALVYKPGAPTRTVTGGEIYNLGAHPAWRDEKGWHNPDDAEKKAGQWNTLECYCFGDTIIVRLNGKVVNHATRSAQTKGKIGLFSFKAEVFFRNLELRPLTGK
jgi:Domain of Unknown Function (DUF1080)